MIFSPIWQTVLKSSNFHYCLLFCLLLSCTTDSSVSSSLSPPTKLKNVENSRIDFLFFQLEKKMECWEMTEEGNPNYLFTLSWNSKAQLPPGIFSIQQQVPISSSRLSFPGLYYEQKIQQGMSLPISWTWPKQGLALSEVFKTEGVDYINEQLDEKKLGRAMILPNDARKNTPLKACFACPHWIAEVYGQLNLALDKYKR